MSNLWIHPALVLILGGLLLPAIPAKLKKGYLLLVPLLVFLRVRGLVSGTFGEVHLLDWLLVFGRVDRLSLVFGYIMSLMCILGTLYGLHVKDDAQHAVSWTYVAGALGVIFAGDLITLFLFWEVMAFSSVFLIWFRGGRSRWQPVTAICWSMWWVDYRCSWVSSFTLTPRRAALPLRPSMSCIPGSLSTSFWRASS